VSFNHACPDVPAAQIADSAEILGTAWVGAGVVLAQGAVVRSHDATVSIDNHSAVLENCSVIGTGAHPVVIGQRTVFGHRCQVIGARVGNLCEIGNGTILMPGSVLGDGCILGEGTLVPAGTVVPPQAVVVGRPGHITRTATPSDLERVARLRDYAVELTTHPRVPLTGEIPQAGAEMGRLYAYKDKLPQVAPSALLLDSAELTGDVIVGEDTIIGAGVKIIGDSHGPVRIGARVQILENTVLHLLPDNELVIEDDVVIGPGAMIHGCHIEAGSVVEPAAIVCDWSRVGRESVVGAGACVKQRAQFPARSVIDGFPAQVTGTLDAAPQRPSWALTREALETLVRL
jgi:carbonic anhydrase/acetyltransferase-like protein (isoleucine patch superfamily)